MSLFDYAQKIVSDKLEKNKSPMLTISMGMEPVMPMAQGGGLSTVQNSLNINGQPHRLAYINPSEKNLLQQLGGSGRKIDGIPAYDDSVDGGSDQDAPDDNDSIDDGSGDPPGITTDTNEEGMTTVGGLGSGNPDTNLDPTLDIKGPTPYSYEPEPNMIQSFFNITPEKETIDLTKGTVTTATSFGLPGFAGLLGRAIDVNPQIGPIDIEQSLYGPTEEDDQGFDQADTAGDEVIKEKIAAVKKVPVEEVTVEEVERAKRLTAAQRVAGTRLEDILDQIYGSGQGSDLLSLAQSGGGIASLQKNINIDGQPHQLSYINPSEENLLRQIGGSGEKINGIPAYMMSGDNSGNAAGTDAANASAAADAANAAQDAAMGQVGGDDIPHEPEQVVAPKEPEVLIPKVEEPEPPKQPRTVNTNLADILQATYPNLSKSAIASMLGGLAAKEEKDSEEDFETDEEIINLLKKEGNPFPTPEDIQKYKSELNMKSILTQVYGNSNLLNNTGTA